MKTRFLDVWCPRSVGGAPGPARPPLWFQRATWGSPASSAAGETSQPTALPGFVLCPALPSLLAWPWGPLFPSSPAGLRRRPICPSEFNSWQWVGSAVISRGRSRSQGPWAGPGSRVLTVGGAPVGRLQAPAPELPSPSPQGAHWPPELSETHDRRPVFFLKYASYSPPQTLAEPLGAPDIRPVAAPAAVGCARGPPGSLPPAQDQPLCPKERVSRGHRPASGFKCMSVSRWPRRVMPTAPRAGPVQRHCVTCSPAGADGTVQIVSRWRGLLGRAS